MTDRDDRPILGIDLGTTHSLVGVMQAGRPVLVPNAMGETLTPSAVAIRDGEVLVGEAARAVAVLHPDRGALAFKRDMGTDRVHTLAGRRFTPPQLSALVLGQLRRDAAAYLGREVDRAVITVPAYFNDLQRQATHDAGRIAGLEVVRLLNEPTGAAMAYGLHQLSREIRAAVLDLGGGTFDVTVLEILEGVIEVRSSAGDTALGGNDFTAAVEALLRRRVEESLGSPPSNDERVANRLTAAAETAKRRLSREDACPVALVDLPLASGRTRDFEDDISRHDVESAWRPLFERLGVPIERALADAGLAPTDVDEVLLVGGATRMPGVRRLAAEIFGRPPIPHLAVDEVVALGATLQAGLHAGEAALEDLVVTDVAPFTLGVETAEEVGGRSVDGLFSPILERGTVIPASRVRVFSTGHPLQRHVVVSVYQGEQPLCQDNRWIGEVRVHHLPPRDDGECHRIDIRFTYDLNGLLEVEVALPDADRQESLVLQNEPGRLSPQEVEVARQAMEKLKFHPRDSLPNTTALARAEEVFMELRGDPRRHLGAAIHHFHSVVDLGEDAELIRHSREKLLALIDALR